MTKPSCQFFQKPVITKSKSHQMKIVIKKINLYFIEKIWDFSPMGLGNKTTRNEQNIKVK